MCKKQMSLFQWVYMIHYNENEAGNENRSHRYGINRHRPKYRHKYIKHKIYLSMMVVIYIKVSE